MRCQISTQGLPKKISKISKFNNVTLNQNENAPWGAHMFLFCDPKNVSRLEFRPKTKLDRYFRPIPLKVCSHQSKSWPGPFRQYSTFFSRTEPTAFNGVLNVSAYGNLGSVLSTQGRIMEAEQAYRRALLHRPNMADVHYNLWVNLASLILSCPNSIIIVDRPVLPWNSNQKLIKPRRTCFTWRRPARLV